MPPSEQPGHQLLRDGPALDEPGQQALPEEVAAESQKDGKLVETVEQVFLAPTDYSPIK